MPFGFKRHKAAEPSVEGPLVPVMDPRTPREVEFEGLTDEWRLRGRVILGGRLLDALNQREPMAVTAVDWCPADGSGEFEPAPGIHAIDPYDLVLVVATPETLAPMTEEERQARRVKKTIYDVLIEAPPYRVLGTVQLHPGTEPEMLLDRQTSMWFALTQPVVSMDEHEVALGPTVDAILVNRFYLRAVVPADRATGEPVPRLPELPSAAERVPAAAAAVALAVAPTAVTVAAGELPEPVPDEAGAG